MTVRTPPAPLPAPDSGALVPQSIPDPEIEDAVPEDGVIDDARARQRRHRWIGAMILAAAVGIGAPIAGMAGGGGGAGPGNLSGGQPAGSGPVGSAPGGSMGRTFAGAPVTQRNSNGVATYACRLAPPNRYLPARSGCVTVVHADVNGDGRSDLVIVYSRVGHRAPGFEHSTARKLRGEFEARAAFLKVVLAGGGTASTRVRDTAPVRTNGVRAAAIGAVAHVNDDPGSEVFLRVMQISSGAAVVAYGFHDGRLVPAGVTLNYGGDSGVRAGFNCLPGRQQRVIHRTFVLLGPTIDGWWRESAVVYAWRGPRLVQVAKRVVKRQGAVPAADVGIGRGCAVGTGADNQA